MCSERTGTEDDLEMITGEEFDQSEDESTEDYDEYDGSKTEDDTEEEYGLDGSEAEECTQDEIDELEAEECTTEGEIHGLKAKNGTKEKINECTGNEEIDGGKSQSGTKGKTGESKPRDIRRYSCQICGVVRSKRSYLKRHIISDHGVEDESEGEIEELIEKMYTEDEIRQLKSKNGREGENNDSKARELRRYLCKICGLVRSKRELLKAHVISDHGEKIGTEDQIDRLIKKKCSEDDHRRYLCRICGAVRSKLQLLKLHIISSHGPEARKKDERFESEAEGQNGKRPECVCDECAVSFRKPAHLKQHKISHTAPRSYVCPIDGCLSSYKRQDHLNRHLIKHEGVLFVCPKEDCKLQLSTLSNLKRHLKQHKERGESWQSQNLKSKEMKEYSCPEPHCERAFKYPSKLAKHLEDVHSTTYTEIICCEPGCLKYFTNAEALREHLRQKHKRICCEICGSQQLKKQIKRHMQIHGNRTCQKSIVCPYERCLHSYTTKSNLNQHIKAVHLGFRPFKCQFEGCEMTFAHKSVRDKHEMCGAHCYIQGDFLEEDAAFQSRPRGGRKRKAYTIDTIFKKRVSGPNQRTVLENGSSFLDWMISNTDE